MLVVALAQQKGGVGKSTGAINLATTAEARGIRTAILDMDHQQGTCWNWAQRRKDRHKLETPIVLKPLPVRLETTLDTLRKQGIQLVFIDLPGKSAPIVGMGLQWAHLVLIPSRPLDVDLEASLDTARACIGMSKPYAYLMNIIPSSPFSTRAAAVTKELIAAGHPVATQPIVQRMGIADATGSGLGINEMGGDDNATHEFESLLDWILQHAKELGHEQAFATKH